MEKIGSNITNIKIKDWYNNGKELWVKYNEYGDKGWYNYYEYLHQK